MSKADLLGAGSSFKRARPVSDRRAAIEAATAAPTDAVDAPTTLNVRLISLNPDNPRSELGDLTDLGNSLRDHGQKTAISIMSRFAYVEANPTREAELEDGTKYVVIDGNSRLAAAREAGLTEIRVMLDDDLGADRDAILESALVANIHRTDLEPLDEAKALQQLLELHGTQQALAARLHRSQGWVAQRLALLKLTPDLQQRLVDGDEPVELLRRVGNQKPENQQRKLEELKEKQEAARSAKAAAQEAKKNAAADPSENAPDYYAVMKSPADADTGLPVQRPASPATSSLAAPALEPRAAADADAESATKPVQAPAGATAEQPERLVPGYTMYRNLPWKDGAALAELVVERMEPEQQAILLKRLLALHGPAAGA
ncbi:ParB/RepB/Spo0J family partition protein [Streptomyces sp. NPDC056069]|uniref:ParB/RepB/Spo0J family partition protein n=1 Tax=Streptomyces sp. NPDC056069 TaxID=3345702 RepID=UPI0035D60A28